MNDENKKTLKDEVESDNSDGQAEISPATDNGSEAGDTGGSDGHERAEESGNFQQEAGDSQPKASAKGKNPKAKREKNSPVSGDENSEDPDTATEDEISEYDRLKSKRKNVSLSGDEVDRFIELQRKIDGGNQ